MAPVAPVRFRVAAIFLFFKFYDKLLRVPVGQTLPRWRFASIAQLAEHALSKRKVTSSILVGGFQCSYGLAWL